jgi:hypothetical protein
MAAEDEDLFTGLSAAFTAFSTEKVDPQYSHLTVESVSFALSDAPQLVQLTFLSFIKKYLLLTAFSSLQKGSFPLYSQRDAKAAQQPFQTQKRFAHGKFSFGHQLPVCPTL